MLWLLKTTEAAYCGGFNSCLEADQYVVRACSEAEARETVEALVAEAAKLPFACSHVGTVGQDDGFWLDPGWSTCKALPVDGPEELLMEDGFR